MAGAAASRNLGMKNARFDYIAFLDADDYFLPDRFLVTKKVFASDPTCEGVYEAAGTLVDSEIGLSHWVKAGREANQLYTMKVVVKPYNLTKALLDSAKYGYFILDSLTIKKDAIKKISPMNVNLLLHQDTDFIIRLSYVACLLPGELEKPVSMVRIHEGNRITAPRSQKQEFKNRMEFWMSLYHWAKVNTDASFQAALRESIISYVKAHKYFRKFPREYFPTRLIWATRLLRLFRYPEMIIDGFKNRKIKA